MIDWQENLSSDEMPPEWMWPIDEAIVEWMDRVREDRLEKYGGNDNEHEDRESVPLMTNDFARGRK